MSEISLSLNSWLSGEMSSETYGRFDIPSYSKGAKFIRNFIIKEQGPVMYRPGFDFIVNTKLNKYAKLHKFIFNDDQAYVLEFTDQVLRFYKNGGLIMNGSVPFELVTPYLESDDLTLLAVAQNADTMYIVHPKYAPRKLTRTNDTSWTLASVTGTAYPFTSSGNYPRAVAFAQGRLWYGGTDNAVDVIWGSKGPNSDGTPNYDNFTTGTADTDAMKYILAPPSGRVNAIEWIKANNKFLLVGTYGGVSKINGGSDDYAITPTAINVREITSFGCINTPAESTGSSVFYVQRNRKKMREIKYYITEDAYIADDKNLVSTEIVGPGIAEICYAQGEPDIIWARCTDGMLIGTTTNRSEGINGWHRHILGGDAIVESIVAVPRSGNPDQLYASIKRTINGSTVRYVECLNDEVKMPQEIDFFTGFENKDADHERWYNAIYQAQLNYKFLDSCFTYDGSDYATGAITVSAPDITGYVTLTAGSGLTFLNTWVGKQIWGKYDDTGRGGGRYEIIGFNSSTSLTARVLLDADAPTLAKGAWYLTTNQVTGINHLEGKTVGVCSGGQTHADLVVSGGNVTLDAQYPVVYVGLKYIGIFQSLDLELGSAQAGSKSSMGVFKRITGFDIKFLNTLGASIGSNLYNLATILYADTEQRLGMPPRPFTGIKAVPIEDGWNNGSEDDTEKNFFLVQTNPQPCYLQIINVKVNAQDDE